MKQWIQSHTVIVISTSLLIISAITAAAIVLFQDRNGNIIPSGKSKQGIHTQAVVSAHRLATEAGIEVLEEGGSAADAAVAVAAALSVVEPWFSSALGGGTWALYYDAETGQVTSMDGVGPTGSLASVSDYAQRADEPGIHQAIVPGAWDGWMLWLDRYGHLELDQILAPAIEIAREGYEVGGQMEFWINRESNAIRNRPNAMEIYAPQERLLQEGDIVYQRDLANTFEALAAAYETRRHEGHSRAIQAARDYYYRGPIAQAIVNASNAGGGYFTLSDFHNFEAQIVDPISIDYSDTIEVFQNPPNSQGITMLLALNILKDYDFSGLSPNHTDAVHLQAEAVKLAFADRYYHVGDPNRVEVPVAELLSDEHTRRQQARINMNRAMEWPIPDTLQISLQTTDQEKAHTTTFHVVDSKGNAAAVTTSLGAEFLVIGDTGIHINNRMRMLALEPGNSNQLTPGYKVRHTSNPYMVLQDGKPYILGGNTGVDTQSQGQMQQFVHVVEFGLTAQEAVAQPRFVSTAFPSTQFPYEVQNVLQMESDFSSALMQQLRSRGHTIEIGTGVYGSANMLVLRSDGQEIQIGAEPRQPAAFGRALRIQQ